MWGRFSTLRPLRVGEPASEWRFAAPRPATRSDFISLLLQNFLRGIVYTYNACLSCMDSPYVRFGLCVTMSCSSLVRDLRSYR